MVGLAQLNFALGGVLILNYCECTSSVEEAEWSIPFETAGDHWHHQTAAGGTHTVTGGVAMFIVGRARQVRGRWLAQRVGVPSGLPVAAGQEQS